MTKPTSKLVKPTVKKVNTENTLKQTVKQPKVTTKKENIVSFTTTSKVTEPVTKGKSSKLIVSDLPKISKPKTIIQQPAKKPFKSTEVKPVDKSVTTVSLAELFMKPLVKQDDIVNLTNKREVKVEPQPETISFKDLMNKPPILNR